MFAAFIRHLEAERRYSPLTVRNYRRDVERFAAWWSAKQKRPFAPAEVKAEELRAWIVHRSDKGGVSAASMNRELSSLRAYFRFLRREGQLEQEPFAHIPALRTSRRLPSFVPESRMRTVLEGCHDEEQVQAGASSFEEERNDLVILLLYGAGLRLAELIAIDRDHFSADYTTLRVRGKGDKERLVPVLAYVREKIIAHLDTISRLQICNCKEKALFLTNKGERISRSTVYRMVQKRLAEAGVQGKKSPHVLRHSFATHLMNGGADMRAIQELMGHASLRSTQVYTHNSIAQLGEVYAAAHPRSRSRTKTEG
ncbi:MAG: tyrosine-type recombinase/integrase [Alistipes sp.]|nr:tyrosine-type recombinase/integrase [Alistipes sp.]